MNKWRSVTAIGLVWILAASWGCQKKFTLSAPSCIPVPTSTATPTLAVVPTLTPTVTPTATNTAVIIPTHTPTETTSPTPVPTVAAGSSNTSTQADSLLSGALYGSLQPASGNLFFSPFSILTALSMVLEGAANQTAVEMQTVLGLSGDAAVRQEGFRQLISVINRTGKNFELSTSNHVWIQQGFPVLQTYIDAVQNSYFAAVANLDFVGNPTGSAQTVNAAVSQETNGKITDLIDPGNITPDSRLILTNAIYFKGTWKTQFEVQNTYAQDFYLEPSGTVPVSMMHATIPGNIQDFYGTAKVLAIPYKDNEASMYVFLPPQGGLAALESAMTGAGLKTWMEANSNAATQSGWDVDLTLPKFTFRTSYDLTQNLKDMGMPLAFASGAADFSGIDGARDLFIQYVVHQAFVAVDEVGTEAAAATGVGMGWFVSYTPPPTPFVVDHPFIFLLVENSTGTILFLGRVNNPAAS